MIMITGVVYFLDRLFGTDKGYRKLKALKSNEVEAERSKQM